MAGLGPGWISVKEAARRMGVTEREVMRQIDSFRLPGVEEEDGTWWVRDFGFPKLDFGLDERERARAGEGERGRTGEEDSKSEEDDEDDEDDSTAEDEDEGEDEHEALPERWIGGVEAAGRMGISKVQLGNLAAKGLIRRVRDYEAGMGRARGRGMGQPEYVYLERDVEKQVKLRVESLELRVDQRKGVWWYGSRNAIRHFRFSILDFGNAEGAEGAEGAEKGIENWKLKNANCKLVPVPSRRVIEAGGSGWVGCRVAAQMLGVCTERMADLARRGALPVYQKKPGQRGSPLFFRVRDVERLAVREEHVARRERLLRGEKATSGFPTEAFGNDDTSVDNDSIENCKLQIENGKLRGRRRRFIPEWEEKRLAEYDPLSPSALTVKDYGEFYTVRQVAIMLWVTTSRVREMRKSGRLVGHQRPERYWNHKFRGRQPTRGTSRWWFFRKEDVDKLQADPAYCKGRRAYEKSLTDEAREKRFVKQFPSEEEIWEYWKANRVGRWPRGDVVPR